MTTISSRITVPICHRGGISNVHNSAWRDSESFSSCQHSNFLMFSCRYVSSKIVGVETPRTSLSSPRNISFTRKHEVRRRSISIRASAHIQSEEKQMKKESQLDYQLPFLTTVLDPKAIDVVEVAALLKATRQNCDLFPAEEGGSVSPADLKKLRRALRFSTIVLAIYARGDIPGKDYMDRSHKGKTDGSEKWPWEGRKEPRLVAFGRATSDSSLTASIYDVAVAPSLQGLGLGRRVVQRITRYLSSRGIIDIAALSPPNDRRFFSRCGFADDMAGSTTMVYTQEPKDEAEIAEAKAFGRSLLALPVPQVELRRPLGTSKLNCDPLRARN